MDENATPESAKPTVRLRDGSGHWHERDDALVREEPLAIRIDCNPVAVTMRTPGDDRALAIGFLYSEGLLRGREDLREVIESRADEANIINIIPSGSADWAGLADRLSTRRGTLTTSSCGVCGRTTIEDLRSRCRPVSPAAMSWDTVVSAVRGLSNRQPVFERTGGLHGAALHTSNGRCLVSAEDIGRHNAVDKVIGAALLDGYLEEGTLLVVSGRASFEVVQKAVNAGIALVASVSAASTLAVDLAEAMGVTLIGFVRGDRGTVYTGAETLTG